MSIRRMIGCAVLGLWLIMGILLLLMKKMEREGNNAAYWMLAVTNLLIAILNIRLLWIGFTID